MKTKKVKIFAAARGFYGRRSNWAQATRNVHKAWLYAYIGRKLNKRHFRTQWIQQINAATRLHGFTYSLLMRWLPVAGITMNRKVLSDLARTEPYTFKAVVEAARLVVPAAEAFKAPVTQLK